MKYLKKESIIKRKIFKKNDTVYHIKDFAWPDSMND